MSSILDSFVERPALYLKNNKKNYKINSPLDLIVASDLHYDYDSTEDMEKKEKSKKKYKLLKQIVEYTNAKKNIDAFLFLGDVVGDGNAALARNDLNVIKKSLDKLMPPYFVIAGNHDGNSKQIKEIFGDQSGSVELENKVLFYFFYDKFHKKAGERQLEQINQFLDKCRDNEKPVIILQHYVIYPYVEGDYYNLTNSHEIRKAYQECQIDLSISGHYHDGISLMENNGIKYVTCPALTSTSRFLHVHIDRDVLMVREIEVQ